VYIFISKLCFEIQLKRVFHNIKHVLLCEIHFQNMGPCANCISICAKVQTNDMLATPRVWVNRVMAKARLLIVVTVNKQQLHVQPVT